MASSFELTSTFVHLLPSGGVKPLVVDAEFWSSLGQRRDLDEGFLVTRMTMREDWPHWEMHPEGEEVVVLLAGRVDLVLDDGQREWTVPLQAGQAWINQRGTWHRAIVHEPSDMLFMTAGKGTRHRPV